ncbi:MAG: glycine oxidase ThiO [Sandaracinus sp.]|nr:glycine oxidase ThiO [Sandaracinus sp.]
MSSDVVIVGGGVMGCASALRLAQAGLRVTVLERSVPGAEASSAAAGILGPAVEAHHGHGDGHPHPGRRPAQSTLLTLGLRSRELHATLATELREEHGIDVGFRRCGVMRVAVREEERSALATHSELVRGHALVETIDGDEARRREPSLGPAALEAIELPEEAQLDPPTLLTGLAIASERAGVVFRTATVHGVIVEGGRARGVRTEGEALHADHVVVAAGSWTSLVPGLGLESAHVHPVRGQILTTRTRPPVFRRIVFGAGGYVVTRPDGRVLCGSTEERVGFRREVTFEGIARIVALATTLAPSLADAPVQTHWSSFRPGTADDLPLVGPAGPEGLWLASGHYRNGILLAPITAELVRDAIVGEALPEEAAALDPRRFA